MSLVLVSLHTNKTTIFCIIIGEFLFLTYLVRRHPPSELPPCPLGDVAPPPAELRVEAEVGHVAKVPAQQVAEEEHGFLESVRETTLLFY